MSDLLDKIVSGIPEPEDPEKDKHDPVDYSTDFEKEYGKKA